MTAPTSRDEEGRRREIELAEAQRLAQLGSWEWEIGPDVVRWSDEMRRIFGVEPGIPLSYGTFLGHVHPEDRARVAGVIEGTLRQGEVFELQHRIVRSSGAVRTLQGRGRVVRDRDGKPVRMYGTGQDITDRLEAEERARELLRQQTAREVAQAAEARFRFLAEASQILSSSLAIDDTLRSVTRLTIPRIADWCSLDFVGENGALRRVEVAHRDPEKVRLAREIDRRFPPGSASGPGDPAAAALLRGESLLIEDFSETVVMLVAREEEHRALVRGLGFVSAMCVPLVARERVIGLITLATAESGRRFGPDDLSLVKSLADRAALAIANARLFEQATAVAHAREDAVATVAHDLRSPLGVMGASAMLLEEPDLTEPERARALERINRAVAGMKRMIDDLLDVTRLEAGGVTLDCENCNLRAVLGEASELEQPAAAARGIRIEGEVEPALRVWADPDRLVQVAVNLLSNAIRHSPEGGRVVVAAQRAPDGVVVSVVDEGEGVPAELREHIFQRFWQTGSRRIGKAGLGLAIARGLVELHGGRIWVEDAADRGARFCFTLPAGGVDRA